MREGVDVIYQANLRKGMWRGRADFLVKVDTPSKLGNWSYQVVDAKLARETRTGTILQLFLYSEMIADIQGIAPQLAYVITPENEFTQHAYRLDEFAAYYRWVKGRLEERMAIAGTPGNTYSLPCAHCMVCSWWQYCDRQRHADDHLTLVAGLSTNHSKQIKLWDVSTLAGLANVPIPLPFVNSGDVDPAFRDVDPPRVAGSNSKSFLRV